MQLKTSLFLMLALGTAEATTITGTFGPDDSFTTFVGYGVGSGGSEVAVEFTPTMDDLLTQIRVGVFVLSETTGDRDLVVDLSQGPLPGAPIETFAAMLSGDGLGHIYTFDSTQHPQLIAGQPYWIALSSNDLINNDFGWGINSVHSYLRPRSSHPRTDGVGKRL